MDRKEAIEYAKFRLECHTKGDGEYTDYGEFLAAAIEAYYKLQHYEDLEEQGRLIELPCKIGDTVYYINTHNRLSLFNNTVVYEAKVARFVTTRYGTSIVIQMRNEYGCTELYSEDNYNKTVFLTKEEAEAALKGEKDEE